MTSRNKDYIYISCCLGHSCLNITVLLPIKTDETSKDRPTDKLQFS